MHSYIVVCTHYNRLVQLTTCRSRLWESSELDTNVLTSGHSLKIEEELLYWTMNISFLN